MQSHLNQQVARAVTEDRLRAARGRHRPARSSDRSPPHLRRRVGVAVRASRRRAVA